MSFSINQVRHLFVASTPVATGADVDALGKCSAEGVAGQYLYLKQYGQGGLVSSDKIDVDKIIYAKVTDGSDIETPLFKHTVTVSTAVPGQVYTIKVFAQQYIGIGTQNQDTIVANYRAKTSDTAANIATGLRVALRAAMGFKVKDTISSEASATYTGNIDLYNEHLFTVTGSSTSIVISEVAPYWELGKFPAGHVVRVPEGGVTLCPILDASGVPTSEWGADVYATNGTCNDAGEKIADLEYLCMGARGDEYRGMGYPRNITTKYMVNPATSYDLIDIHYYYQGPNESVQKSEKDLTIVIPHTNSTLVSAINTLTDFDATDPRYLTATT